MKHSAVLFLVEQIEQAACVILRPSPPPYFTTPFWIIEAINTPINIQADLLTHYYHPFKATKRRIL